MKAKRQLRKHIKALRRQHSSAQRQPWDEAITAKLLATDHWQQASTVMAYHAMDGEVATARILNSALASGKALLLPRCFQDRPGFEPVPIGDLQEDMVAGSLPGLFDPNPELPVWQDVAGIDLIIVPGLAFDLQGNRLGYGKGMYDRFLGTVNCVKIALAFEFQVVDAVPVDERDERVDLLLTEKALYKIH